MPRMSLLRRRPAPPSPPAEPAEFNSGAYAELMLDLGIRSLEQHQLGAASTHLRAALNRFRESGNGPGMQESFLLLARVAEADGRTAAARHYSEESLALARRHGDRIGLLEILLGLGHLLAELEDPQSAIVLEEALAVATELDSSEAMGRALLELSRDAVRTGHPDEAMMHCEAALRVWREAAYTFGETVALNDLSLLQRSLGQLEAAVENAYAALELAEAEGDRAQQADILDNLCSMLDSLRPDEADALHEWALDLREELGDEFQIGRTLTRFASAELALDRVEVAYGLLQRALEIQLRLEDHAGQTSTLFGLSVAAGRLGRAQESADHHLAALQAGGLEPADGSSPGAADLAVGVQMLIFQARAAAGERRPEDALRHARQAVELARSGGDGESLCAALTEQALLELGVDQGAGAVRNLEEALQIARNLKRPMLLDAVLGNLAWAAGRSADSAAESRYLEERASGLRQLDSAELLSGCLQRLVRLELRRGNLARATDLRHELEEVLRRVGTPDAHAAQLELEAELLLAAGRPALAVEALALSAQIRFGTDEAGEITPDRYSAVVLESPLPLDPEAVAAAWSAAL